MRIVAGWATDVGLVRSINEDSYLVDEQLHVFAVADGVGGHRGGEVASSTAIETLRASLANHETIAAAIQRANAAVYERSMSDSELYGMGTTMTVAAPADEQHLLFGHVGDSRAYLLRDGELHQITDDHSMVGQLVRDGQITEAQAAMHPRRNVITRAVGMEPFVDIDIVTLVVHTGDRLLLCSDGITDMLRDDVIRSTLRATANPQSCAESLADQALANGGVDNLTAVVLDVALDADEATIGTTRELNVRTDVISDDQIAPIASPSRPQSPVPPVELSIDESELARPDRSWWRRTRWLAVTVLPLVAVFVVGYFALRYNNDRQWFVGTDNGNVALFRGSADKPLGWEPKVEASSSVAVDSIAEPDTRDQVARNAYCATSDESEARSCYDAVISNTIGPSTSTERATTSVSSTIPTSRPGPTVP